MINLSSLIGLSSGHPFGPSPQKDDGSLRHVYVQSTAPILSQGVKVGDLWSDTSSSPPTLKVCSSISPITFVTVGGGGGGNHNLLSATHLDTLTGTVVRGDLIVGNSTPQWSRLALGSTDYIIKSNGTDAVWSVLKKILEDFHLTGDITPPQITSDQNNYNPSGLSTASVLRLDANPAVNITGLAGGDDGRIIVIINVGTFTITLKDNSTLSLAQNRFKLNGDIVISPGEGVVLIHGPSPSSDPWFCVGRYSSSTGGDPEWIDEGTILRPGDAADTYIRVAGSTTSPLIGSTTTNEMLFDINNDGTEDVTFKNDRFKLQRVSGMATSPLENEGWIDTQFKRLYMRLIGFHQVPKNLRCHQILICAKGSGASVLTELGDVATEAGTGTIVVNSSGSFHDFATAATTGSNAGAAGNAHINRSHNPILVCKFYINSITSVRVFVGLTLQTAATQVNSDDPASNYAGVQFSTPRGDVNWQWVSKDDTTQQRTNSGIPAVANQVHILTMRIDDSAGRVVFQLDDNPEVVHSTNIPTTASNMRWVAYIQTQAAEAKSIGFGFLNIETDK